MKNNNIKFETKTGGFILGREPKPKKGTLGYAWEKENKYRNVKIKPLLDNNAWIDRFDRKFKDEEFGPANYTHYFNESRIYQQIKSFIQTEIDRAVEEVLERVDKEVIIEMPLPKRLTLASKTTLSALDIFRDEQRQKLLSFKKEIK